MDKKPKKKHTYSLKRWVFYLILFVIFLGFLIPYAIELICTFWFPEHSIGISQWNQFVSIILGVVATVLSIVSIIMGFKNYDDTLDIQEKFTRSLEGITSLKSDIKEIQTNLTDISVRVSKFEPDKDASILYTKTKNPTEKDD